MTQKYETPECCGRKIDLVAVQDKSLFFQCKVCGKVICTLQEEENNE